MRVIIIRPIDHGTRFTNHFLVNIIGSVFVSCACCSVKKMYTIYSDGALYTDRHFYAIIPTLFAYFLACHPSILLHFFLFFTLVCVIFVLVGNCFEEKISVALSSKIVDRAQPGDLALPTGYG